MTASDKKEDKVEDVEMKDESAEKEEKKDPDLLTVEDIREHCKLIRRSVESKESRSLLELNTNRSFSQIIISSDSSSEF